jgi:hypothetical protein
MHLYSQRFHEPEPNRAKMTQNSANSNKTTKKPATSTKKPPNRAKSFDGPQREALEKTIEALRLAGRLDDVADARVQIARGLASAVDAQPDNPTIWREYRAAEKALREESENHADPFDQLIASIASEVGNTSKQKAKDARA